MKVALIGGKGFVGSFLQREFNDVLVLDKNDNLEKIAECDIVINLAGATILKRWNESYKKLLYSSRIETTQKAVEIINKSSTVKHFISTSAIGYYPDGCECDETSKAGDGFLAKLAIDWEKEAFKCNKLTTILRFGVVIDKNGGALKNMILPFKLGLGGSIGDGKMNMSFIDMMDLMRIYHFVIDNKLSGIFNATSPKPTTNYELTKTLGKILHRPTILPVPKFMIKLLFGEGSEVLLSSQKVYPKKLIESGFEFKYETIKKSLERALKVNDE
jgi:uncharacterized protein (TIGR01777 family)